VSVEDIILDRDRRGISELRPHLPPDFCDRASDVVLDNPGTVAIVTGFYILTAGATETDGPPGAVAMGRAVEALGREAVYVTDEHSSEVIRATAGPDARVVEFPMGDDEAGKRYAGNLLGELDPSVLIAIERCGLTADGRYRNMRGLDISEFNARIDHMFHDHPHTVGIGDGGNEIGMGNLASAVTDVPSLVKEPCVTRVSELVISSVSNWGGYGLVAAMSAREGRNLLLSVEEEKDLIRLMVDAGAVDGITSSPVHKVDGFTLEENAETLERLHDLLTSQGVPPASGS
jgi:hypothetical protein